jgi:crotonobetainyl-CoA:carnitine CoA-transferase CaiB-like acyl-CoA transferase
MPGALDDVVVLEFATGVSGPYTGKLLADLGAQVIKVESVSGDPLRSEPPLVGTESAFFNWMNLNKLGVPAESGDGPNLDLAAHADIVLHNLRGDEADEFEHAVSAANPAAVIVSYSPYGRSGPRANWSASPLTEWATSGFHYIAGDPAREPLALPGYQAEFHAGLHGGTAALAALWHARNTGEGQRIEISHQEATLSDHAWLTTSWTHQGKIQSRTGSIYAPCSDGFVYIFNLVPYPNLFILIERFDLLEDEALLDPLNWGSRFVTDVLPAFAEWTSTRTKQEVYHACQELRVAASPVNTMKDVAESGQLAAREWFIDMETGGRTIQAPGFPYRLTETPCEVRRPAPAPAQHDAEVRSPSFAWANAGVVRGSEAAVPGEPPLTGLRVIEVTANWAGPAGGRQLADLGADVIKIELRDEAGHPLADVLPRRTLAGPLQSQRLLQQAQPQQAGHLPQPLDAAGQGTLPSARREKRCCH